MSHALIGTVEDWTLTRSGYQKTKIDGVWYATLYDFATVPVKVGSLVEYRPTGRQAHGYALEVADVTKVLKNRPPRRNSGERYLIQGLRPKHRNWVTVDFADDENRALLNALRRARLGDVAYRVWDTHLVKPVWQGHGKDAKIDRWQGARPSGLVGANRRTTMLRNPRLSPRMMPLRENTMRLGDAMKWGRRLLDAGIGVHLWDGSGWEVDFKPDDSYSTPSGRAATGGRRYLAQGAGLIKTWPITLTAPKVAPGMWLTGAAIGHFLAHRKAGVASNPGACRNPICVRANPRRASGLRPRRVQVYCRMCGQWDPAKGPYRVPKVGPQKGNVICDQCYRGWRSGRRAGEKWAKNQGPAGENPRIAHEQIVEAFLAGRSKKIGPRYWTDGQLLRVWGNLVAKKEPGAVIIMDAGWRTLLTRNVLNTVLQHMGGGNIYQQKHQWYISTPTGRVTWPGEWTIPVGGATSNSRRVARNGRGENLTVSDIAQWIDNDEGLYNWWRRSRQSKTAFIRENRTELEGAIRGALNRPPAQKTWRDYAGRNPRRARRNPVEGWVVTQDGETLKTFGTTPAGADGAFKFLKDYQTKSIARAILEEGYDIRFIRNGAVLYTAKKDPLFKLTAKRNPLTRSESAVLLAQAKGHVALARAYRGVKKHGIASYAAGRAQGKAAAVRQFGPKSALRAARKILDRQAATNPRIWAEGTDGDARRVVTRKFSYPRRSVRGKLTKKYLEARHRVDGDLRRIHRQRGTGVLSVSIKHSGLKGLMKNGDAKKAMSFA